jgi:hypothetical protein
VDPMNPEARRVVQLTRQARTPSTEDKRRVRAAIGVGVAAAAVATSTTTATAAAVKAASVFGVMTGLRGIAAVVAVVSASAGAGAYWHARASRAHAPTAVHVTASQQAPQLAPQPIVAAEAPSPAPPVSEPRGDVRPRAAAPQDPLSAELTLLHTARQAWQDGKPQLALDLAQKHARLYPRSQLASERDALRVFALCGLDRTSEARDLASALLARAPGSPLRASLEQSCAMRPPK